MEHGHKKMKVWQTIDAFDWFIQKEIIPRIPKNKFETINQIDSASDSMGSNFVEGYYSGSIKEYLRFLGYSKRSLGEVEERVRRVYRKGYINIDIWNKFDELANKSMYMLNRLIDSLRNKCLK